MKDLSPPVQAFTGFYKHRAIIRSSGGCSSLCTLSSLARGEVRADEQDLQQGRGISGLGGPNRSDDPFALTCSSSSRGLGLDVGGVGREARV